MYPFLGVDEVYDRVEAEYNEYHYKYDSPKQDSQHHFVQPIAHEQQDQKQWDDVRVDFGCSVFYIYILVILHVVFCSFITQMAQFHTEEI
jgi:hypothetical protein